jgi:hypothetical protein
MNFNKHSDLIGEHAFLSPSKHYWINYDEERMVSSYGKYQAVRKGTELHDFAAKCIKLRQKLPKSKIALNMYVNDAIGFRMFPEQPLFYSINCFGTTDAISFREDILRVHDLKTGVSPVSIDQLKVYAALFCLEYLVKPFDITMELRIYQTENIVVDFPTPEDISGIMEKIIVFDARIEKLKLEERL